MAKLFTIALISWSIAMVVFAGTAWLYGRTSVNDVLAFGIWGGFSAFFSGAVVFTPVMFALRNRTQNLWVYVGAGVGLAVVPLVVFAAMWNSLGSLFSGIAAWFLGTFMVFGVCFGTGFHWWYVRRSAEAVSSS